jgi:hypothetical protein
MTPGGSIRLRDVASPAGAEVTVVGASQELVAGKEHHLVGRLGRRRPTLDGSLSVRRDVPAGDLA